MTLACMHLGMTVEESFQAVTYYSAKALELEDKIGSIEVGKSADLIVWGISSFAGYTILCLKSPNSICHEEWGSCIWYLTKEHSFL